MTNKKVITVDLEIEINDEKDDYDKDVAQSDPVARNSDTRKRIDELMEKKRLRDLLDESDDW